MMAEKQPAVQALPAVGLFKKGDPAYERRLIELTICLVVQQGLDEGTDEFMQEMVRRLNRFGLSEERIRQWCQVRGFDVERNVKG